MEFPSALRRPAWYFHRLGAMPPQELPFRVVEQVHRALGRRADSFGRPPNQRADTSLGQLIFAWVDQPGVTAYWAQQASEMTRGEVTVFGRRCAMTSDGIPDWDVDPVTGYRWPQDYCFDVPLAPKTAHPVEVKYVWELNRLVYLLPVAAHAATHGDIAARQLCRSHLEDWIRTHPARQGVHWRSGIELAIRVLVFVVVCELVSSDPDVDPAFEDLVSRSVADHVDWIRRFPSRYSSANNHRVAELAGLLIAVSAYPQLGPPDEVENWWTEFETVVLHQFHPDGVPVEQATMYSVLVLEWVSICLRLARRQGRELAVPTQERVSAAAGFLADLTDNRGQAVRFGDDDDSRLLTAARPHADLPTAVVRLLSQGLGVPAPEAHFGLSTYAEGGYSIWRSGSDADEILWMLDHGALGMGRLAAHAHADTLAVYLHVGGRPVFVDAGTYLYHSTRDWRDRLRRTAEHNTVAVEGVDSSVMAGPFNWRRSDRADGQLVSVTASPARWVVEAEHHGYARRYGVAHRRTLEGLGPQSFRLRDRLTGGSASVAFRWSLLLAPGLQIVSADEGWLVRAGETVLVVVKVPDQWRETVRVESAWCSPSFGQIESTSRLVIEGDLAQTGAMEIGITVPRRTAGS